MLHTDAVHAGAGEAAETFWYEIELVLSFENRFSSLGLFSNLDENPAWLCFGKPFFGTPQCCACIRQCKR